MIAATLTEKISGVCPINGVSIGVLADKTTWRIDYAASATQAQKDAAKAIVTAFDVTAETAKEDAQQLADLLDAAAAKADSKITALKAMAPAQVDTWVDNNINTLADQKALDKTMLKILCVLARRL